MWTPSFLIRWLLLLSVVLLCCSGCSAADWTLTRTHDRTRGSFFRPAAPPQVIVVPMQMAPARPTATVAVERDPIPATLPPLLTAPQAVAPLVIPTAPDLPRKKVTVAVEK